MMQPQPSLEQSLKISNSCQDVLPASPKTRCPSFVSRNGRIAEFEFRDKGRIKDLAKSWRCSASSSSPWVWSLTNSSGASTMPWSAEKPRRISSFPALTERFLSAWKNACQYTTQAERFQKRLQVQVLHGRRKLSVSMHGESCKKCGGPPYSYKMQHMQRQCMPA